MLWIEDLRPIGILKLEQEEFPQIRIDELLGVQEDSDILRKDVVIAEETGRKNRLFRIVVIEHDIQGVLVLRESVRVREEFEDVLRDVDILDTTFLEECRDLPHIELLVEIPLPEKEVGSGGDVVEGRALLGEEFLDLRLLHDGEEEGIEQEHVGTV